MSEVARDLNISRNATVRKLELLGIEVKKNKTFNYGKKATESKPEDKVKDYSPVVTSGSTQAEPKSKNKIITDLADNECRWPTSTVGSCHLFCANVVKKKPYCDFHQAQAKARYQ